MNIVLTVLAVISAYLILPLLGKKVLSRFGTPGTEMFQMSMSDIRTDQLPGEGLHKPGPWAGHYGN